MTDATIVDLARQAFGEWMRAQRVAHSLTQLELSLMANLDRRYLQRIERGVQTPSVSARARIAAALGGQP